jgi:bifunctional DNA-binding transcriptional regulator/antitoxin component of YhaV-PrlF toxin-antitoxin module
LNAFDVKMLGETIAKALGLKPGDDLELSKDRLDPNRLLVVRHPQEESVPNVQGSSESS